MNGSFSVVVVTENWFEETVNKNSLLEIPNYSALHKTRKNKKRGGICLHIHESVKFNVKLRHDTDIFHEPVETLLLTF